MVCLCSIQLFPGFPIQWCVFFLFLEVFVWAGYWGDTSGQNPKLIWVMRNRCTFTTLSTVIFYDLRLSELKETHQTSFLYSDAHSSILQTQYCRIYLAGLIIRWSGFCTILYWYNLTVLLEIKYVFSLSTWLLKTECISSEMLYLLL